MSKQHQKRWAQAALKELGGHTIVDVRYLSDEECEAMGWYRSCPVLILSNGAAVYPSSDDEGNDAGALFTTIEELETIPVCELNGSGS